MTDIEREAIRRTKLFLFDLDGTLYLGNRLFDFTEELLDTIKASGKRYMFMTNNSSKGIGSYIEKMASLGIGTDKDDYITSSQATSHYISEKYPDKHFYVCGTRSFYDELASSGVSVCDDILKADAIVMGFDTELTFKKLDDVCSLLCKKDVPYIASHPDMVCPTEYGSVPDCGSVCDMVYNATKKRPDAVIGKPGILMPKLAMEKCGVLPSECAVVGDRLYTDVLCGINAKAYAVLVLSGETTPKILEGSNIKPDAVFKSAGEIIDALK